ncbi:MAG: DUF2851 family protein [Dehalococcoidales bacterium]|nr:DUF2851 family protein [Dehalococcoidales bacterium]
MSNFSERQVTKIWQHLLLSRTELTGAWGEQIKVVYPGRANDDRGADFRDAVVVINQMIAKGDIEIHVKSSGWRSHRHHRDPVYNRVILHVVMWHDAKSVSSLYGGKIIPIVALEKYVRTLGNQWLDRLCPPVTLNMPCVNRTRCLTEGTLAEFLDSAGEARFLTKAAMFQADLAHMEAGQALYQGIMGALGYAKNKVPFMELARWVPLHMLETVTRDEISGDDCLARQQALLLGTAGLLPSQQQGRFQGNGLHNNWVDKLEKLWNSFHQTEVMSLDAWHLFKVRPSNSPVRRIAAMSYFILRYREMGVLEGIISLVKEAMVDKNYRRLEDGLTITTNGYWATHFDFGASTEVRCPNLLGNRRAADIVVNVILPFTFGWAKINSQLELGMEAFTLYRGYPRLSVNSIERHMIHQLGLSSNLVNSARRQQGLIHIYNTLCSQGKCDWCPLGKTVKPASG